MCYLSLLYWMCRREWGVPLHFWESRCWRSRAATYTKCCCWWQLPQTDNLRDTIYRRWGKTEPEQLHQAPVNSDRAAVYRPCAGMVAGFSQQTAAKPGIRGVMWQHYSNRGVPGRGSPDIHRADRLCGDQENCHSESTAGVRVIFTMDDV